MAINQIGSFKKRQNSANVAITDTEVKQFTCHKYFTNKITVQIEMNATTLRFTCKY